MKYYAYNTYKTVPLLHTYFDECFFFVLFFFCFCSSLAPCTHSPIHHAFQRQLFIIIIAIAQFKYLIKLIILHLVQILIFIITMAIIIFIDDSPLRSDCFYFSIIIYLVVHCIQYSDEEKTV